MLGLKVVGKLEGSHATIYKKISDDKLIFLKAISNAVSYTHLTLPTNREV